MKKRRGGHHGRLFWVRLQSLLEVFVSLDVLRETHCLETRMPAAGTRWERLPVHDRNIVRFRVGGIVRNTVDA
jgi:hypothetical protein